MRHHFIAFVCVVFYLPLLAQQTEFSTRVVNGELIRTVSSLKNLKNDPKLNPPVTRDLTGTLIRKSWKETVIDYGTHATGDPVVQREKVNPDKATSSEETPLLGTRVTGSFDGMGFTNVSPADPCLTQGPNHVIQMVNGSQGAYFQIWNKSGVTLIPQTYMYQLIATPGYSGSGDPIVLYDQFSDRYFLTEFGTSNGVTSYINTLIFAVSRTNDPTAGWNIYKFVDNAVFIDYPHYAVWPNAIFGTSNDFNTAGSAYLGTSLMAFDKAKMLAGDNTASMIRMMPASFTSGVVPSSKPRTTAPVSISGPGSPVNPSEGLFLYFHDDNLTSSSADVDSVGILGMNPDFSNPANSVITLKASIPVAAFKSSVCGGSRACIPGGSGYDAISDRFMHRISYRNFGTYEALVANHTVDANYPTIPAKAGIRWYEFRNTGSNWSVFQQGTYAPDADGRWMGSININSKGQIGLAFNLSGVDKFASIYFTGRNSNDPAGIMVYDEGVIQQGTSYGTFSNRWGDYSDLTTDVNNDSIFWFTAMYGAANWRTRVSSFKLEDLPTLDARLSSINSPEKNLAQCSNTVNPVINLRNVGRNNLTTADIYYQLNNNTPVLAQKWTGNLSISSSVTVNLPTVTGPVGVNQLKIFLSAPNNGDDQNKLNDTLSTTFMVLAKESGPASESFENPSFPVLSLKNFRVYNPNPGSTTWARTTSAKKSGTASGIIDFYNYASNLHEDFLLSPILDVDQADSVILSFGRAYRAYSTNTTYADGLALVISNDCGATFTEVWRKEGVDLATVAGVQTTLYVPGTNDWLTTRIDLKPFLGNSKEVIIGFKSINRFGNSLYLDDIQLTTFRLPRMDALIRSVAEPGWVLCERNFTPKLTIANFGKDSLKTVRIFYQVNNAGLDSIDWKGALATGQSAIVNFADYNRNLAVNTGGRYTFTAFTKMPNGLLDQNNSNDTLAAQFTVFDPQPAAVTESFEQANFPPNNWAVVPSGNNYTWERSTQASSEQISSAWIRNYRFNSKGKPDDLFSPLMEIKTPDSIYLKFDVAHTTGIFPGSTALPLDTLEVLITSDCGKTFQSVYKKWGQALTTTDKNFPLIFPPTDTVGFYPNSPLQWRKESLDVTAAIAQNSKAQFVFRNTSNKGNNTFIDKIAFTTVILPERLKKQGYLIAPNPFEGYFTIRHLTPPKDLKGIIVTNNAGQVVFKREYSSNAPQSISVNLKAYSNGLYQLQMRYENKVLTERILKGK